MLEGRFVEHAICRSRLFLLLCFSSFFFLFFFFTSWAVGFIVDVLRCGVLRGMKHWYVCDRNVLAACRLRVSSCVQKNHYVRALSSTSTAAGRFRTLFAAAAAAMLRSHFAVGRPWEKLA